jgi:hypothetical protein
LLRAQGQGLTAATSVIFRVQQALRLGPPRV